MWFQSVAPAGDRPVRETDAAVEVVCDGDRAVAPDAAAGEGDVVADCRASRVARRNRRRRRVYELRVAAVPDAAVAGDVPDVGRRDRRQLRARLRIPVERNRGPGLELRHRDPDDRLAFRVPLVDIVREQRPVEVGEAQVRAALAGVGGVEARQPRGRKPHQEREVRQRRHPRVAARPDAGGALELRRVQLHALAARRIDREGHVLEIALLRLFGVHPVGGGDGVADAQFVLKGVAAGPHVEVVAAVLDGAGEIRYTRAIHIGTDIHPVVGHRNVVPVDRDYRTEANRRRPREEPHVPVGFLVFSKPAAVRGHISAFHDVVHLHVRWVVGPPDPRRPGPVRAIDAVVQVVVDGQSLVAPEAEPRLAGGVAGDAVRAVDDRHLGRGRVREVGVVEVPDGDVVRAVPDRRGRDRGQLRARQRIPVDRELRAGPEPRHRNPVERVAVGVELVDLVVEQRPLGVGEAHAHAVRAGGRRVEARQPVGRDPHQEREVRQRRRLRVGGAHHGRAPEKRRIKRLAKGGTRREHCASRQCLDRGRFD